MTHEDELKRLESEIDEKGSWGDPESQKRWAAAVKKWGPKKGEKTQSDGKTDAPKKAGKWLSLKELLEVKARSWKRAEEETKRPTLAESLLESHIQNFFDVVTGLRIETGLDVLKSSPSTINGLLKTADEWEKLGDELGRADAVGGPISTSQKGLIGEAVKKLREFVPLQMKAWEDAKVEDTARTKAAEDAKMEDAVRIALERIQGKTAAEITGRRDSLVKKMTGKEEKDEKKGGDAVEEIGVRLCFRGIEATEFIDWWKRTGKSTSDIEPALREFVLAGIRRDG